jgi:uncharacterized protein YceH (UPF0502 family)
VTLTTEDIEALKNAVVGVLARKIDDLDANMGKRFDALDVRLFALETRVGRIEERLGQLVRDVTRGRTSDSERIAQLETRVAELEARLGAKS